MGSLNSRQLVEYVKENSRTKPYPSKKDIADEFQVSKDTVDNHAEQPRRQGLVKKIDGEGGVKRFIHEDNPSNIGEEIEEVIERVRRLLDGRREPTLEEVANLGNFDPEDEAFRENFHNIREDQGFSVPAPEVREEENREISNFITDCILIEKGWDDRHMKDEELEEAERYLDDSSILDEVEIHANGKRPDGKPDSVVIDFSDDLETLLGETRRRIET